MAFINKIDPVVLNIKITSKGRERLSQGHLHFKYFAFGDSEIDYTLLDDNDINSIKILRPADKNPNILSFVTRNFAEATDLFNNIQYNEIQTVPSISWEVENSVESIGFFSENGDNFEFKTTPEFVKQPDIKIDSATVNGGNEVNLLRGDNYGSIVNEPSVGDYLLIRWNSDGDYVIDAEKPTPILIYKIMDKTGSLSNDTLVVTLDRNLPYLSGSGNDVIGMVFHPNIRLFVEQQFSTDYASEALLSFLQNCQCDTIIFPFWNLSIIYTENIDGVKSTDRQFTNFDSSKYGGFVQYIQNQEPTIKKLGVIHYSNVSPANVYAEQFLANTPKLFLPTIMWHKSVDGRMGLTLQAIGMAKTITGVETSLDTTYYDLGDNGGNIVGKVFNDLKLFVIEDPELLFAMSYKSNRSWTLPNFKVGVNDVLGECEDCPECPECDLDFDLTHTNVSVDGGSDGTIIISNVINNVGTVANRDLYYNLIQPSPLGNLGNRISSLPFTMQNKIEGTYIVKVIDGGADNCIVEKSVTITSDGEPNVDTIEGTTTTTTAEILDTGGENILVPQLPLKYFVEYRKKNESAWTEVVYTGPVSGMHMASFNLDLIGLEDFETYEYRAGIEITTNQFIYGDILEATVGGLELDLPKVNTGNPINVTEDSFTANDNEVVDDNNSPITEFGIIWGTSQNINYETDNYIGIDSYTTPITTFPHTFSGNATGLNPDTQYCFRAYAVNGEGVGQGDAIAVNTPLTASIITVQSTQITNSSFQSVGGSNIQGGGRTVTLKGIEFKKTSDSDIPSNWTTLTSGSGTSSFTLNMTNLDPDTEYDYKAFIELDGVVGRIYGATITESTFPLPSVVTKGEGEVSSTTTSITIGGKDVVTDNRTVLEYGVQYRLLGNTTWIKQFVTSITGDDYEIPISGLNDDTTYEYRAYLLLQGQSTISVTGLTLTIKTDEIIPIPTNPPTVSTGNAIDIDTSSMTIQENTINNDGGSSIIEYGVIYTQNPSLANASNMVANSTNPDVYVSKVTGGFGSIPAQFSRDLVGLDSNSTVWFRAFAENVNGYGYGVILNTSTLPVLYQVAVVIENLCSLQGSGQSSVSLQSGSHYRIRNASNDDIIWTVPVPQNITNQITFNVDIQEGIEIYVEGFAINWMWNGNSEPTEKVLTFNIDSSTNQFIYGESSTFTSASTPILISGTGIISLGLRYGGAGTNPCEGNDGGGIGGPIPE